MSAVIQYKSSDPSAPVLTGQVGTLTNLLNQCLVVGYAGRAAAGWSSPWSATNQQAFKGGAASNGMILRILDDAALSGGAKESDFRGFEFLGGTAFPATATNSIVRKSITSDSTPREWMLFADDRSFYMFLKTGDSIFPNWTGYFFGDFISYYPGTLSKPGVDTYGCAVIAKQFLNEAAQAGWESFSSCALLPGAAAVPSSYGHWLARTHTQVAGTIGFMLFQPYALCGGTYVGSTPRFSGYNLVNLGVSLGRLLITYADGNGVACVRGHMPGLSVCGNGGLFADDSTMSGTSGLDGKEFVKVELNSGGHCWIETTPWR